MVKKITGSQKLPLRKRIPALALVITMLCPTLSASVSYASPVVSGKKTKDIAPIVHEQVNSTTLSLKQLGAPNAIQLLGQDGRNFINFNVRNNEVVSEAKLKISYKYSPDLLPEQSQINIYLNGESLSAIEISKGQGNQDLEAVITIPPELFSENNQFTFQLIGHYASDCEDPKSPKLWANISNQSTLRVTTLPLTLPNELANFPIPFASKNDSRKLVLPFIFTAKPSNTTLEAAGILSSWFGSISNQSGSQFPVAMSNIPSTGNAVIFVESPLSMPGIALPVITGPMVFITSNPKDQYGKLLFVMGRDSAELKQASIALALGGQNLAGQSSALIPLTNLPIRKSYDAPNWLSSNGPVQLSKLNGATKPPADQPEPEKSTASPNVQIPPALYSANGKGIPLHLDYSYQNQASNNNAVLSVTYKSQLVKTIALPMQDEWTSKFSGAIKSLAQTIGLSIDADSLVTKKSTVFIPQAMIYPSPAEKSIVNNDQANVASFLLTEFAQSSSKRYDCSDPSNQGNIEATINPNSTIDISGMQHFIRMPNLAAFSNSGFPFSRLADLSETAVVLPDNPNVYDYSAYLAALGRTGRLTGYPGTSITVTSIGEIGSVKEKDLLVITSGSESQPLLKQWESSIPINNHSIFKIPNSLKDIGGWFSSNTHFDIYQNTFIAGFKSPLQSSRSVVLISSFNPEKLTAIAASLDGSMGPIFGSLVRLNEDQIELVSDQQNYHSGSLPWANYLSWLLSEYLSLFILFSVIAALILSLLMYAALKAVRRKRLQS